MATTLTRSRRFRWSCKTAKKYSFMLCCVDTSEITLLAESLWSFLDKSGNGKRLRQHLQICLICRSSRAWMSKTSFVLNKPFFICACTPIFLILHNQTAASISCRNYWTFSFRKLLETAPQFEMDFVLGHEVSRSYPCERIHNSLLCDIHQNLKNQRFLHFLPFLPFLPFTSQRTS